MKRVLQQALTWWNGRTLGTWLDTALHGVRVGSDRSGNVYYRSRRGDRRWVIYNGESEASRVPPDWHGWLHHICADPPTVSPLKAKGWERAHQANRTGSAAAWRPRGSLHSPAEQPARRTDYRPWRPPEASKD